MTLLTGVPNNHTHSWSHESGWGARQAPMGEFVDASTVHLAVEHEAHCCSQSSKKESLELDL
jgi:hypothetical protein